VGVGIGGEKTDAHANPRSSRKKISLEIQRQFFLVSGTILELKSSPLSHFQKGKRNQ
jgi:hypothetical protein